MCSAADTYWATEFSVHVLHSLLRRHAVSKDAHVMSVRVRSIFVKEPPLFRRSSLEILGVRISHLENRQICC
jgi:hypothetical protein